MPDDVAYKPLEELKPIYQGGTITPPKFLPSYIEWLYSRGNQLIQGGSVMVANTYAIYTVPKGFALFLTNVYLGMCDAVADKTQAILYVGTSGVKKLFAVACNTGTELSDSITFNYPIRLYQGEQILLTFLANALVQYGISGFLVRNDDILTF